METQYDVHGKQILWDNKKEIGICKREDEDMLRDYAVSNIEKIIGVANELSKKEALKGTRLMQKRASRQIKHPSLEYLSRFKEGIENSGNIYRILINALEE